MCQRIFGCVLLARWYRRRVIAVSQYLPQEYAGVYALHPPRGGVRWPLKQCGNTLGQVADLERSRGNDRHDARYDGVDIVADHAPQRVLGECMYHIRSQARHSAREAPRWVVSELCTHI